MKYLPYVLVPLCCLPVGLLSYSMGKSAGVTYGTIASSVEQKELLKSNIWLSNRLKENPEWDVSIVSSVQMTDAYTELLEEKGVTAIDLLAAQGNANTALRNKAKAQSKICNNPNSNAQGPKDTQVANPTEKP